MLRRAVLRLAAALSATLLAGACLSPTLPLPPPETPDEIRPSAEDPGAWEIAGDCYPEARVTLFNEDTRKGVVVECSDNARYLAEIRAEPCDLISISQEVITDEGTEESGTTQFLIEERTQAGPVGEGCH